MAEISALEDKFGAWETEDEQKPIRALPSKGPKIPRSGGPRMLSSQNRQT